MGMWQLAIPLLGSKLMTDPPFCHPKNPMIPPPKKNLLPQAINNNRSLTFFSAGAVVTAVSYITRNAAPPAGTDTPVVGKVKMMQSVRWLKQSILPRSHGLPCMPPWKDHGNEVNVNPTQIIHLDQRCFPAGQNKCSHWPPKITSLWVVESRPNWFNFSCPSQCKLTQVRS